jgi:hypothetical protein
MRPEVHWIGLPQRSPCDSGTVGNGAGGYSGDGGPATAAELDFPYGVAVDGSGNIYIVDNGNNRIRKVTVSTGTITTVADIGLRDYSGDGGAATAARVSAGPSGYFQRTSRTDRAGRAGN